MKTIVVITTMESIKDAKKISDALLKKHLCACVQTIGPISSAYWWKGKISNSTEYLLLIKTKSSLYKKAEKEIIKIHPYETPEIIALPSLFISANYQKWLTEQTL